MQQMLTQNRGNVILFGIQRFVLHSNFWGSDKNLKVLESQKDDLE